MHDGLKYQWKNMALVGLLAISSLITSKIKAQTNPQQSGIELPQITLSIPPRTISKGKKLILDSDQNNQTPRSGEPISYRILTNPRNGGEIIRFSNGSEVSLTVSESVDRRLTVPMEVNFSTCAKSFKKPICKLSYFIVNQELKARWTKHHNKKMLGTEVERTSGDPLTSGLNEYVDDFSSKVLPFDQRSELAPTFSCDDYSWLIDGEPLPDYVKIREWSQEINEPNNETTISENRAVQSILGIELKKVSSDSYKFVTPVAQPNKLTLLASPFEDGSNNPAVMADVIGWNVEVASGSNCDVGFRTSLDAIGNELDAKERTEKPFNKNNFPYLWRSIFDQQVAFLSSETSPYVKFLPQDILKLVTYGFFNFSVDELEKEIRLKFRQEQITFIKSGAL